MSSLYPVKLRAIRTLYGDDYGRVEEGGLFTTNNLKADKLEARGLAYRHFEPKRPVFAKAVLSAPENKAIVPDDAVTVVQRRAKTYSTK